MKDLVFGSVATAILCVAFFITLLLAIFSRRRKTFLVASIVIFLAAIVSTCYTVFTTVKKVTSKVDTVARPRNGKEIYTALLGKPDTNCVKFLEYLDQTIPIMDYATALHFETCPQEFQRMVSLQKFSIKKEKSSSELIQPGVRITWLRTDALGDSINVYTLTNQDGSGQTIYSSLDSTNVMLIDYAH